MVVLNPLVTLSDRIFINHFFTKPIRQNQAALVNRKTMLHGQAAAVSLWWPRKAEEEKPKGAAIYYVLIIFGIF